jgi:N-acetylmuramoyl-L-alanine amidase
MKLSCKFFIKKLLLITFLLLATRTVQANKLEGVRAWPSPDNTRVVLDLSGKPNYETHYLKKPNRLVIDIKSTNSLVNLKKISHKGPLVKNIRESGSNKKGTYRLVVDLKQASKAKIFTLAPAKPYGHRLVIDLPHQTPTMVPKSNQTAKIVQPGLVGRDVFIAIDAGHGGEDPGALGKFSYEKDVTLQIAKRLKKRIDQQPGMRGFLIRTGDYYVNLNKRSELAFKGKADFLVSIHADGFTSSQPSGASVWILSDRRANSEMGRRMERHEVHSELLGGKGESSEIASSVPFLNKVFFDMSKSNSMKVGSDVGHLVVKELKKITKLHKKKPVGASLAVLKSPYIPSILVEAGFITNHREERLLNQAEYQTKVANSVFKGIYRHFRESPPHDSLFAQKKRAIKHTVRSGESLSILASRYSVSSSELKAHNHLKSSSLRIGQVLKIPSNYQLVVKRDPAQVVPTPASILTQVKIHKVKRGESLSVIADRYGATTNELKKYNNLRSTSLAIGQKINIPLQGVVQTARAKPTIHKVRAGESLSVIAKRYGKTTSELKKYNKLRTTSLAINQQIKIPSSSYQIAKTAIEAPVKTAPLKVHKVKRGESLSVIAKRYGKTTRELKSYNKLRSMSLMVGQKIKIPNSGYQVAKTPIKTVTPKVHKVKRGESLSVIANRYNKTTRELKSYNGLRSTSLSIGQKIKIPSDDYDVVKSTVKVTVKTAIPKLHKVKSGESLSVIAKRYGKTTSELKNYNKLRSTSLSIGQKIKIPNSDYTAQTNTRLKQTTTHKVRSGESLSVIAKLYGTTASLIKSINKLRSSSLAIGQLLTIPTT